MSIKRWIAFIIDYMICAFLNILIYILLLPFYKSILNDIAHYNYMPKLEFTFLFRHYVIGISFVISLFLLVVATTFFAYLSKGMSIGDRVLNIKVYSRKVFGIKFLLLRFTLRTITVFAFQVFIFINIIIMVIKKNISVAWYDDLLGVEIIESYDDNSKK